MQNLIHKDCPRCNAKISLGSRAVAKKIRCPQCREVIVVTPENAIPPPEDAFVPMRRGAGFLGETEKNAFLRHLAGGGERHITISAAANDPDALLLSHSLKKLFRAAGWKASSSALHTEERRRGGLALYAGAFPFPEEVTKSCMALTAAGLKFTSHIDPSQVSEKAVLVVGRDLGGVRSKPAGAAGDAEHPVFEENGDAAWADWLRRMREIARARGTSVSRDRDALLARGVRLAEGIALRLSEEGAPKKDAAKLRELSVVLTELRKRAGEQEPPELIRECARLALAILKEDPGTREWTSALRFADAVFAKPPVSDDRPMQDALESLLAGAFRDGSPAIQRAIAVEVRAWHWFRTPERRALHDELFYEKVSCGSVLSLAIERLQQWPPAERERIARGLLQRQDLGVCEDLAETLGFSLGWESMTLDAEERRLPAAALAGEVLEAPDSFPLLKAAAVRREFLLHFVIGMTEGAAQNHGRPELAKDFGAWCRRAWLEQLEEDAWDPRRIALLALYWLGKRPAEAGTLVPWWRALSEMLGEVVRRGNLRDIYLLFATLRDGAFNELATVEEWFELIDACLGRIDEGFDEGPFPADPALAEDLPAWRDLAGCMADILARLLAEKRLPDAAGREMARQFLLRLATELGGSCKAAETLLLFEEAA